MYEILEINHLKKSGTNTDIDPTCFDNNIHIRLKTFKEGDMINGLESKLILVVQFLLTRFIKNFPSYKIDFAVKDNSESTKKYIFSKYINEFKITDEYQALINALSVHICFTDILIKPVYSKKVILDKKSQLGNLFDLFEADYEETVFSDFIDTMIRDNSLKSFLFDNRKSLLLIEAKEDTSNKKYENKAVRKLEKELLKNNNFSEEKLW